MSLRKEQVLLILVVLLGAYLAQDYFSFFKPIDKWRPRDQEYTAQPLVASPLVRSEPDELVRREFRLVGGRSSSDPARQSVRNPEQEPAQDSEEQNGQPEKIEPSRSPGCGDARPRPGQEAARRQRKALEPMIVDKLF